MHGFYWARSNIQSIFLLHPVINLSITADTYLFHKALLRGIWLSYTIIRLRFPFICIVHISLFLQWPELNVARQSRACLNVCFFSPLVCVHSVVAVDWMCLIRLLGGLRWKLTPVTSEPADRGLVQMRLAAKSGLELPLAWDFQNTLCQTNIITNVLCISRGYQCSHLAGFSRFGFGYAHCLLGLRLDFLNTRSLRV